MGNSFRMAKREFCQLWLTCKDKTEFEQVEEEVAKLHSYDTFVLQSVLVTKISKKAKEWLTKATYGEA